MHSGGMSQLRPISKLEVHLFRNGKGPIIAPTVKVTTPKTALGSSHSDKGVGYAKRR